MPRPRIESWKNLEENPWKMSILEYLGEFQWFWAVLEERKQEGRALDTQKNFQILADQTACHKWGFIVMLKDELEEMGFIKLVDNLKYLNLIQVGPENKSKYPLKVAPNLLVRVIIGIEDCFCSPIKNRVFDNVVGQIRIFLFHTKMNRRA